MNIKRMWKLHNKLMKEFKENIIIDIGTTEHGTEHIALGFWDIEYLAVYVDVEDSCFYLNYDDGTYEKVKKLKEVVMKVKIKVLECQKEILEKELDNMKQDGV